MIGQSKMHFGSLKSTNDYLKEHAYLPDGTVVTTDYQTKGKGRHDRIWDSARFQNILMSILLKPNILVSQTPILTQIASVAICDTLVHYELEAKIKWPNDVLVHDKKIAGILVESSVMKNELEYVIMGIGFNVNQTYFRQLSDIATSIKKEKKVAVHKEEVEELFLERLNYYYLDFLKGNTKFRQRYNYFKIKDEL